MSFWRNTRLLNTKEHQLLNTKEHQAAQQKGALSCSTQRSTRLLNTKEHQAAQYKGAPGCSIQKNRCSVGRCRRLEEENRGHDGQESGCAAKKGIHFI
jgi:hypothetical protein